MPTSELNEQLYGQVAESIKIVLDLTSRIDERVKMMVEQQNDSDEKFAKLIDSQNSLINRIVVLESKDFVALKNDLREIEKKMDDKFQSLEINVHDLSRRNEGIESKWNKLLDIIFKLGFILLAAYLLYKFGLQAPL